MQSFVNYLATAVSGRPITCNPELINIQELTDVMHYIILIFFPVICYQTLETTKSGYDVTYHVSRIGDATKYREKASTQVQMYLYPLLTG